MRPFQRVCAAVLVATVLVPFSSATDKIATPSPTNSRSTPIVEAVKKTRAGVVDIRIPQPQGLKDLIGSGVIVDESGLIVTNRHVTAGKKYVGVRLFDGTELKGEVVAADSDLDLAIIRVKTTKKLTALPLGTVDDMMVGETVLAFGSPFGYAATVSRGIISALNREINMPNDVLMTGLIQHDAPINPGNSGGPLVNINAEVIGINVAMRDGAQNIAFAINASTVQGFLNKYSKRVSKIEHGLKVEEKVVAETGDRQRVVVKNAAHAELKSGDEIRTIADRRVGNTFDIERALWHTQPGQKVEFKVVRQGREMTVMVTLEASNGAGSAAAVSQETPAANASAAASRDVQAATRR